MSRLFSALLLSILTTAAIAGEIRITPSTDNLTVEHNGKEVQIQRNQNPQAVAEAAWSKTSRNCPPFCVQPMVAAPGVLTVGIREVVEFMRNELAVGDGVLIDARTEEWYQRGTIPGSVNIPYTRLNRNNGADELVLEQAMERFGVSGEPGNWDFSNAKKLVLWCNGWWCGQSPAAIRGLLNEGYPAERLLYFRGGMQNWKIYGLNTVQ